MKRIILMIVAIFLFGCNDTLEVNSVNTEVIETSPLVEEPMTIVFEESSINFGDNQSFKSVSGDFNQDQLNDVFVTSYHSESKLWLNTGNGFEMQEQIFSMPDDNAHWAAVGDLDGDKDLDVFLVNNSSYDKVFINDGFGHFEMTGQQIGDPLHFSTTVQLEDVENDGDLDALISHYDHVNTLYLNDGTGMFEAIDYFVGGPETVISIFCDIDQDDDLDIFLSNHNAYDQLLINNGKGEWKVSDQVLGEVYGWGHPSFGDIDGDVDIDIVIANTVKGNQIWLNDGNGLFSRFEDYFGYKSQKVFLEDIDGDEDLDLLAIHLEIGNQIFLNDKGVLSLSEVQLPQNALTDSHFVDLNNDGLKDIVTGVLAGNGGNKVFLNKSE